MIMTSVVPESPVAGDYAAAVAVAVRRRRVIVVLAAVIVSMMMVMRVPHSKFGAGRGAVLR
jgi:hypothetical protein